MVNTVVKETATTKVNAVELIEILLKSLPAHKSVLVSGPPGCGKTSIFRYVAKLLGMEILMDHPVYGRPTDASGIPWINQKTMKATYCPAGKLAQVLSAKDPLLWLIDDFAQATPIVQAAYMPPLLDREVNGNPLPECVAIGATCNRKIDKAASQGMIEPVKGRFHMLVELLVELQPFETWWLDQDHLPIGPLVYLRTRFGSNPQKPLWPLFDFNPTADLVKFPCPRGWEQFGDVLNLQYSSTLQAKALAASIGEEVAEDYAAIMRTLENKPDIDGILADPQHAPLPDDSNIGVMYAVAAGLATKASPVNFGQVLVYANRMHGADMGEHAILTITDATTRKPELASTIEFAKFITSTPLGKEIGQMSIVA